MELGRKKPLLPKALKTLVMWFTRQFRFVAIRKYLSDSHGRLRVLDIGCGRTSPILTTQEFDCEYHAVDLMAQEEILSLFGSAVAKNYHQVDLELDGLHPVQGERFDLIVLSHIVEHLDNGLEVIKQAAELLSPGGVIYIEYPRLQSVNFPSMEGTLNFWDDHTHKRFYQLVDVANTLTQRGVKVTAARTRRFWRRILLLPVGVVYSLLVHRKMRAGLFWDLFGFAEYAIGVRVI